VKQFLLPNQGLANLDSATASMLITAVSDVALLLTPGSDAVIHDVAFGNDELASELDSKLRGRPWMDTVTHESRAKVQALLNDAATNAPRWRQINHNLVQGTDLPVMYAAVQVGTDGGIVAVGRSMRPMAKLQQQLVEAQQSMDREYLRLRQAETRHRLLFQLSSEAVLIVDAVTQKIVDANPVAQRLLADGNKRLIGKTFLEGFDAASKQAVESLLGAVLATGRAQEVPARSAVDKARDFFVSASLFREGRASFFLIRVQAPGNTAAGVSTPQSKVMEVVNASPDGFVVTDLTGRIQFANRAFLDCVQLATAEQVRDQALDRWLGRSGVDYSVLSAQLREHGSVRRFATILRGEFGAEVTVEIGAVAVPDGEEPCHGFTIREVGQRAAVASDKTPQKPRSVQQLTELVGRVPLKELVRDSTDMIEKLCIEAALELTGDNRASAADILGLSRQSLYAKLRRYGLGDLDSTESADEPAEH
jgi:transcriptional regulator PpsR